MFIKYKTYIVLFSYINVLFLSTAYANEEIRKIKSPDQKVLSNTSNLNTTKVTTSPREVSNTTKEPITPIKPSYSQPNNIDSQRKFSAPSVKIECAESNIERCLKILKEPYTNKWSPKDIGLLVTSIIALIVSLGGHFYNWHKDNQSRLRSINDDFWIRKIVSPVTIEPLIKDILEVIANLPEDCGITKFPTDCYKEFTEKYHPKIQQLLIPLQALKLLDNSIYSKSNNALTEIEDIILDYCGNNSMQLKDSQGNPANSKTSTKDRVIEKMIDILTTLKSYQTEKV